jgi:hypothetical protein
VSATNGVARGREKTGYQMFSATPLIGNRNGNSCRFSLGTGARTVGGQHAQPVRVLSSGDTFL